MVQVKFTGEAIDHIRQAGGSVWIILVKHPVSCCGSLDLPHAVLEKPQDRVHFRTQVINGLQVYIHEGLTGERDIRVRVDSVWRRKRLAADWI